MKAWAAQSYGKPRDVLRLVDMPQPEPAGRQVLVRIHASSINPIDLRMVQGYSARLRRLAVKHEFPFITGRDVVGEVVAAGPQAEKFKPGVRVVGITGIREIGAHSEYSAIEETNLALAPDDIPSIELAAIPYVAMTSWTALVSRLGMDPDAVAGKHLFVHAGSGGIGSFAVQWAHSLGMRVSTTCGSDNVDWVRALGADTVIDYQKEDYRQIVSEVDYAYDTLGGAYVEDTAALVGRGGGYVSIVHQMMPHTDRYGLVVGGLAIAGTLLQKKIRHGLKGRKFAWSICQPSEAGIEHVMAKVARREIRGVVEQTLPMTDILQGYDHIARGSAKGKTVLVWD